MLPYIMLAICRSRMNGTDQQNPTLGMNLDLKKIRCDLNRAHWDTLVNLLLNLCGYDRWKDGSIARFFSMADMCDFCCCIQLS